MLKILRILFVNYITAVLLNFLISAIAFSNDLRDLILVIIAGNIFIAGALALTSITGLLSIDKDVSANGFLSFLSFFLLPLIVSGVLLKISFHSDLKFYLVNVAGFNISLFAHYVRYRRTA
jgi:hypothetical protein